MATQYGFQPFGTYTAKHRKAKVIAAAVKAETDLYNLSSATLGDIRSALTAARTATLAALSAAPTGWQAQQQQAVLTEVERALRIFQGAATTSLSSGLNQAHDLGSVVPIKMLQAGGLTVGVTPTISTAYLAASYTYSAGLIKDVTIGTVAEVERLIRQAGLAQASPWEVIRQLGPVTGKGAFATAFHRAEAITRTEMGRVGNTAAAAQLHELAAFDNRLQKEWHATIDSRTRRDHVMVNGQIRDDGKPFDVNGHPMLYPHDPRGPAKETVRCRCFLLPAHPEWDEAALKGPQPATPTNLVGPGHRPVKPSVGKAPRTLPAVKAAKAPRPARAPRKAAAPRPSQLARQQAAAARAAARAAKAQATAAAKAARAAQAQAARVAKAQATAAAKAQAAAARAQARQAVIDARAAAKAAASAAKNVGKTVRPGTDPWTAMVAVMREQFARTGGYLFSRTPQAGDSILARFHDALGLGRPQVVNWGELRERYAAGEVMFFRAVKNNPDHHNQFRYGQGGTWMGFGIYGNGMYGAASAKQAGGRIGYGQRLLQAFRESAAYGQREGRPDLITAGVIKADAKVISWSALQRRIREARGTVSEARRQYYRTLEADVVHQAQEAGVLSTIGVGGEPMGVRQGISNLKTGSNPAYQPYAERLRRIQQDSEHDRAAQTAMFEDASRYALSLGYDVIYATRTGRNAFLSGSQYINILNHSAVRLLDRQLVNSDVAWITDQD